MTKSDSRQLGRTTFQPDQIVVDTRHLAAVRAALDARDISVDPDVKESRPLGLTLLSLGRLAGEIGHLRRNVHLVRQAGTVLGSRGGRSAAGGEVDDLDLLMFDLRGSFADAYGGWVPTMGKNRFVTGVQGLGGEIGGGGPPPRAGGGQIRPLGEIGGGGPPPRPGAGPVRPLGEIGGGGERELRRAKEPFTLRDGPEGANVRIAVIDTKIWPHPELRAVRATNPDAFFEPGRDVRTPESPMAGHGTFGVSRILTRAPAATLLIRPVLDNDGDAPAWDVATAMAEFVTERVDILHLPLGCRTDDGDPPLVLSRAVEVLAPQTVVVAAAGNYAARDDPPALGRIPAHTPIWPAALAHPGVVAVGARDADGEPARFSPDEPWLRARGLGVDVHGLYLEGKVAMPERARDGRPTGCFAEECFHGSAVWQGSSFAAADWTGRLAAEIGQAGDVDAALEKLLP